MLEKQQRERGTPRGIGNRSGNWRSLHVFLLLNYWKYRKMTMRKTKLDNLHAVHLQNFCFFLHTQ